MAAAHAQGLIHRDALLEQCLAHVQHPLDSALPSALQKRSGAKLKFIRFVKFAIAGALVMTGISILVMLMSSKNPRVPNSATP